VRKIDAFAHILPPSYARRLESIMSDGGVSDRILGYQPWIHEDPALTGLDARWRAMDPFSDYVQVLTLAVPPPAELGEPGVALDLARAANDELAELVREHPDRFAGFSAALPMNDPEAARGPVCRGLLRHRSRAVRDGHAARRPGRGRGHDRRHRRPRPAGRRRGGHLRREREEGAADPGLTRCPGSPTGS
jgi:hypothetical protein